MKITKIQQRILLDMRPRVPWCLNERTKRCLLRMRLVRLGPTCPEHRARTVVLTARGKRTADALRKEKP